MSNMQVLKASAGSGKTYHLALSFIINMLGQPIGNARYKLRNSNQHDYHQHILAITFTNMATDEMKSRIIHRMYELSQGKGPYLKQLLSVFNNNATEIAQAAKCALADMLFNYSAFNVSTIDSFFQTVLRSFARELEKDYNYNIEIDDKFAISVAVHDLLLDISNKKSSVLDWVLEFVKNNVENGNTWDFFGNESKLVDFAGNIGKEFFRRRSADVVKYLTAKQSGRLQIRNFKKNLIEAKKRLENKQKDAGKQFQEILDDAGVPESALNKKMTWFLKILKGQEAELTESQFGTIENKISAGTEALPALINKQYKDKLSLSHCEKFAECLKGFKSTHDKIKFLDGVIDNLWHLGLLGEIYKHLEAYRKDNNIILLADTNDIIDAALKSGSEFIYERVGSWLKNIMIDEFQDTSRKQYENFMPLLKETLSNGNENLIIGDEKQAIYRFRNSDPALLRDEIYQDFNEYISPTPPLSNNFRSCRAVVNFNNDFFSAMIGAFKNENLKKLEKTYSNIHQNPQKTMPEGYVTVNIVNADTQKQAESLVIEHLPNLIHELVGRGFSFKDIAILVSTHHDGMGVVERLMQHNENVAKGTAQGKIEFMSQDSLKLYKSPIVRLIINLLKFIDSSFIGEAYTDENALDKEMKWFLDHRVRNHKRQKALYEFETKLNSTDVQADPGQALAESFAELQQQISDNSTLNERLKHYAEFVAKRMPDPQWQLTNVFNVIDNIIADILPGGTSEETAFILSLQNEALKFSRKNNGGTIREFLEYWEINKEKFTVCSSNTKDAVQIQTIHSSKGLEYGCVIIPFANWDLEKISKQTMWIEDTLWSPEDGGKPFVGIDKENGSLPPLIPVKAKLLAKVDEFAELFNDEFEREIIDNINKTYVAFTRPKQELHVFVPRIASKNLSTPTASIKTAAQLVATFIEQIAKQEPTRALLENGVFTETDDEEQANSIIFKFGSKSKAEAEEQKPGGVVTSVTNHYPVVKNERTIRVSLPDNPRAIKDEGNVMHAMMQKIKNRGQAQAVIEATDYNRLFKGNLLWTKERAAKFVEWLVTQPETSPWFDEQNKCFTERTISLPFDEEKHHFKPDRVVLTPGRKLIIVDYKFGRLQSEEVTELYKNQVKDYAKLLESLYSGFEVEGYIVYAVHNRIVRVV